MNRDKITVYYDGDCPRCLRELAFYAFFDRAGRVEWCNIVGNESVLREQEIDPDAALKTLHLTMPDGSLLKDMDAFIVLWKQVPIFRPLAWFVSRPSIKSFIEKQYARVTLNRLRKQGRLCDENCSIQRD